MDARPNFAKIRENGKKDEGRWRVVKGKILPFTHESPVFIGFSGEQVKGEGKNHFSILNFLRYKGFSKIYHIYFYRNTATINFYNNKIREQNAKQIFLVSPSLQSALGRALLCQGKGTFVLGQKHFCAPEKHKRAQVRHHP